MTKPSPWATKETLTRRLREARRVYNAWCHIEPNLYQSDARIEEIKAEYLATIETCSKLLAKKV
jgi:hypothetical protein